MGIIIGVISIIIALLCAICINGRERNKKTISNPISTQEYDD